MRVISEGQRFRECVETFTSMRIINGKRIEKTKSRTFHQKKTRDGWIDKDPHRK